MNMAYHGANSRYAILETLKWSFNCLSPIAALCNKCGAKCKVYACMGINSGVECELLSQAPGFTPTPILSVSSFLKAICRIEQDVLGNRLQGVSNVSTTASKPTWRQ